MNIQGILPAITSPLLGLSAQAPKAAATSSTTGASGTSSTGSNSTSASSLQQTFLNLLVTELQNQDPTAPVDPTEMVGQLVSLNQLDQLISINSTLGSLVSGSPATSNASSQGPATLPFTPPLANVSGTASNSNSAAAAALQQLQNTGARTAGMNSLMNLYGTMGAPAQNTIY